MYLHMYEYISVMQYISIKMYFQYQEDLLLQRIFKFQLSV